ncbi:unnamed protein product [Moneuplotes crassus]|uniref:Uncharacterized protein n=1 Tax=Euplotes crassus TaxID=5936 RepID=A0AAD1XB60_EUPCR|nr:unnamed protein product [Moneuplotes crassus]
MIPLIVIGCKLLYHFWNLETHLLDNIRSQRDVARQDIILELMILFCCGVAVCLMMRSTSMNENESCEMKSDQHKGSEINNQENKLVEEKKEEISQGSESSNSSSEKPSSNEFPNSSSKEENKVGESSDKSSDSRTSSTSPTPNLEEEKKLQSIPSRSTPKDIHHSKNNLIPLNSKSLQSKTSFIPQDPNNFSISKTLPKPTSKPHQEQRLPRKP